ncbi:MAG: hypothetical protein R6V39_07650, partial [Desulfovibrionales bacterium]
EIRLYDRLFKHPNPTADEKKGISFLEHINPDSLEIKKNCLVEPALAEKKPGYICQFERKGYFAWMKEVQKKHWSSIVLRHSGIQGRKSKNRCGRTKNNKMGLFDGMHGFLRVILLILLMPHFRFCIF